MKTSIFLVISGGLLLLGACQNNNRSDSATDTAETKDSTAFDANYQFRHTTDQGKLEVKKLNDIPLNVDVRPVRSRGRSSTLNPYQLVHLEISDSLSFGILGKFEGKVSGNRYNNANVHFMSHTVFPETTNIKIDSVNTKSYEAHRLDINLFIRAIAADTQAVSLGSDYKIPILDVKRNTKLDFHLMIWDGKDYVEYKRKDKDPALFGDRACTVNLSF